MAAVCVSVPNFDHIIDFSFYSMYVFPLTPNFTNFGDLKLTFEDLGNAWESFYSDKSGEMFKNDRCSFFL